MLYNDMIQIIVLAYIFLIRYDYDGSQFYYLSSMLYIKSFVSVLSLKVLKSWIYTKLGGKHQSILNKHYYRLI